MTPSAWRSETNDVGPGTQTEVWAKHLADGNSVAVALLNLGQNATTISASWKLLGLPSSSTPCTVRDLWAKKDIGAQVSGHVTASAVPSHGTALLKISWGP